MRLFVLRVLSALVLGLITASVWMNLRIGAFPPVGYAVRKLVDCGLIHTQDTVQAAILGMYTLLFFILWLVLFAVIRKVSVGK